VIDITSDVSKGGGEYTATADDVKKYELSVRRKIKPGSIVVFRSDWSLKYDDYLTDGLPSIYPSVSLDALKFLHDER
jgi:kynurenine formamidase